MTYTVAQVELLEENRDAVEVARLFEVVFASATYRFAEAEIEIKTNDGKVWQSCGGWIRAAPVSGGDPLSAEPAIYTVLELGPDLITAALHDPAEWYDAPINQYFQLYLDGSVVGPPVSVHHGLIRDIELSESVSQQTFDIRAESLFAVRNWTALGEYTDRDQQGRSALDRGCEYVATFVDKVIKGWLKA